MKLLKKILCAVVCLALLVALAGCSTPQVALTVDGKDYSTGEYLANLYNQYSSAYNSSLYYYEYYGQDIWSQTFPYGEKEEKLGLADYLIASTKDVIIRQKAVENMMAKYDIKLSKEEETELAKQLASVAESDVLALGFNKENYGKMVRAFNYNESALFYGLYKEGGERALSKADLETYVKENFLSYQMFSIELVSSNGSELEDNVKTAVKEFLNSYLTQYNKSGDLAAVFKGYLANVKKGVELKDKDGKTLATLSWKNGAVVITLPNAKKDESENTETEDPTCERQNNDVSAMDEDLIKAIKKIKEGEAAVITYSAGGTTDTAALIVRFAPLSGKNAVDLKKDEQVENVIYYAKYDAFDEEVEKAAKALKYTVNERAIKMCRPEYFDPNYQKGQTTTTTQSTTAATTTTTTTTTTAAK